MTWFRQTRFALLASLIPSVAAVAEGVCAEPVDVELILAVDVSLSMSPDELAIQRDGYVAALTHEQVIRAIQDGVHGKIALTYMEWAGVPMQNVVVPWTVISSREEAEAFAQKLTVHPPASARRTSLSAALHFASDLFAESSYSGTKRVVDISGDGPNNQGSLVTAARDALVEQGIVINGLPLMTRGTGFVSAYDVADLDLYYQNCVVGGPGSFMIPVNDWSQFPEAVRRKLVLELAGPAPGEALPVTAAKATREVDCEVGEKMWRQRNYIWDSR